jgi:type II secretion system protein I
MVEPVMTQTSRAGTLKTSREAVAFTLVEVLAALAIAAIGLLALLRLHLAGLASVELARAETAAVFIAQEKMAEASAGRYPSLVSQSGVMERDGTTFEWTASVTEARPQVAPGRTASGLREIRTTVSWPHGSGHKEIQMSTYAAESQFVE